MNDKKFRLIHLSIVFVSVFVMGISIFARQLGIDDGQSWGLRRVGALSFGIFTMLVAIALSFPSIKNFIIQSRLFSKLVNLFAATFWCLIVLLIIEFSLRLLVVNMPFRYESTNWFGDIPAKGSFVLWGKEGYAITFYDEWGEIHSPLHSDENILFLGDSFTEEFQVGDSNKYPSIAEEILHEDGFVNLDARNFGKSGLAMGDYVTLIPLYKKLLHPVVIVLQISESDFIESFSSDKNNYFVAQDNKITDLAHKNDVEGDLIRLSNGYFNFTPLLISWGNKRIKSFTDEKKDAFQNTGFNTDLAEQQMQKLVNVVGDIPLIVVVLPTTPRIQGDDILISDTTEDEFLDFLKNYPKISLVNPSDEFLALLSEGFLPYGFFNSVKPGQGHLNRHGNRIIGELVASTIESLYSAKR